MDGWGCREQTIGNAVALAKTPNFTQLLKKFPHARLRASGEAVGLPKGLMGNSEVGHLTIGAGRALVQKLTLISNTIRNGSFFDNPVLVKALGSAREHDGVLHLIGLVSDGCVHSSPDHLDGLLELVRRNPGTRLIVHPILDGRDTPPRSALGFVKELKRSLTDWAKLAWSADAITPWIGTIAGNARRNTGGPFVSWRDTRPPRAHWPYNKLMREMRTTNSSNRLSLRKGLYRITTASSASTTELTA